ncbi:MAG: 4-phosphopantetheinyl transferase [Alphaproteobacteria bacterium]|nr:4-phosphopantetheinyl transferase [Alphaproteobacteria bacterium]
MSASARVWWTLGAPAEPALAKRRAEHLSGVPPEWRRGLRGQFLHDVARQCRNEGTAWSSQGGARGWRFNLSAGQHLSLTDSGDCLIVAVGNGAPIGIDAERVRTVDHAMATLDRLGLARQAAILGRMAPAARNLAFLHLWTAFEALLKLERLPWEAAAARFAALQDQWRFANDGTAAFIGQARLGLAFQSFREIPGILLTVAAPVHCSMSVRRWQCDPPAMPDAEIGGE